MKKLCLQNQLYFVFLIHHFQNRNLRKPLFLILFLISFLNKGHFYVKEAVYQPYRKSVLKEKLLSSMEQKPNRHQRKILPYFRKISIQRIMCGTFGH